MICIRRRSRRRSLWPSFVTSVPSKRTLPLSAWTSRRTACAVEVLPQPDSPTSATISPFATLSDTPDTAFTWSCGRRRTAPESPRGTR